MDPSTEYTVLAIEKGSTSSLIGVVLSTPHTRLSPMPVTRPTTYSQKTKDGLAKLVGSAEAATLCNIRGTGFPTVTKVEYAEEIGRAHV